MNLLFLTLCDFESIEVHNIYTDLLREFRQNGHKIYSISPLERKKKRKTYIINEDNTVILKLCIGNIQKTNIIEKGISTILIEPLFINAIKKYFSKVHFDLILYSTPPITLCKVVEYVKKRDKASTYLLLKDIFPQNSVDIGMIKKEKFGAILYQYFRNKEKKLYQLSDKIGCMSQANVEYLIQHNPEIDSSVVEICPNSIEVIDRSVNQEIREKIRKKYKLPLDKTIFLYGGNLGKPQGIDFLIRCIYSQRKNKDIFFFVVGNGTEYAKLQLFYKKYKQNNFKLLQYLPKEDYDKIVASCDVGMIFLDYRFTIPNFPSRLLDYMAAKLPVLACTDSNTDVGKIIVDGDFGWWCVSDDIKKFEEILKHAMVDDKKRMGENAFTFLLNNYQAKNTYDIIMRNR